MTDFYSYASAGKASAIVRSEIASTLSDLSTATTPEDVKLICQKAMEWLKEQFPNPATQASYCTAFRKGVAAYYRDFPVPDGLLVERQTAKGLVAQHMALNHLLADPEAYAEAREKITAKTEAQRDNLTPVAVHSALEALRTAITSDDWRELAAALMLAVQARPSDILKSGSFEAVSSYRVSFTTRAKQRNATGKTSEVFTLIPAVDFIDAISRLRRTPDVAALKNLKLAEVDSGKNSTINRAVNRVFGEVITPPYGETELSCKNLRAVGVVLSYHLFGRDNQAIGRFAELQLIHDNPASAANYEDYYAVGPDGTKLGAVGTMLSQDQLTDVKPMAKTRTSVRVDKLTMEKIKGFRFDGTLNDQVNAIAIQAEQAQDLARQLERAKAQIEKLKGQINTMPSSTTAKTFTVTTEAQSQAAPKDDIRKLPDEALKGKKPGYAAERIRRAVAAIQDYNTGRELSEQIEINVGSLRALASASPVAVGEWVKAHADELTAYTEAQGHPGGANSKHNRGKDVAALVPLAWNQ